MKRSTVLFLSFASLLRGQSADLAVVNARIYTVNPQQPQVSSLAVRGGKVQALGDRVKAVIGPATKVIDAHGATVIPGFIDAHGHVRDLGEMLEQLDLRGDTSVDAIAAKVKAAAVGRKPGEWILGQSWDQNLWVDKQFPNAEAISAAAPDNPVSLARVDGHAVWVNRKALSLADVNAATPDPAGGKIMRDAKGTPTGVFLDNARGLVEKRIPPSTPDQVERLLRRAAEECARLGITTVHDAGVQAEDIAAYRALIAKNQLPIRVYAMVAYSGGAGPGKQIDDWLAKGPEIGDYLTVRSFKLVDDGALGSRGAAMIAPYSDDPGNKGLLIIDGATIRRIAERAVAKGFQVNTHAIGDLANRTALDAYGSILRGRNDKRFRIEHAQIIAPEDFAKFKQYSVIASMQPTHATSDMLWAGTRVGPERLRGTYAWQTLMKVGVHVPSGSDFPVESPNPIPGFYAAVTRQKPDGTPAGGWMPEQKMTREQALRSWTIEGAYAAFEENRKGSLEPGKDADFVMLSDDIMTVPEAKIQAVHVTMTVVGGKVVSPAAH